MSDCLGGITTAQREGSYVLNSINTLQTQVNTVEASVATLDNEIYHDDSNYIYVSSTESMDYDPAKQFNVLVGVDGGCIGNKNCTGTTILGARARVQNGDYNIAIGANANILYTGANDAHRVNKNIVVGTNAYIRNPADAAAVENNINLGHDNEIDNGNNNIVVGNEVGHGGQINNSIILAQKALNNNANTIFPTAGSVIISASPTGYVPSVLPKVQFLSDGLTRLQGTNVNTKYDPAVTFATPAAINGYMRIRYHGQNLLIPVLHDANDADQAPAY
jgi:hypothetical protein